MNSFRSHFTYYYANEDKNEEAMLSSLCKKCPYSELFWSAFSRVRTEYGEIWSISPNSFRMRENADQSKFEYGHFLRSVVLACVNFCAD